MYEFRGGSALAVNRRELYWFNSLDELVFKFDPSVSRSFIENREMIGVIKVNNWLNTNSQ